MNLLAPRDVGRRLGLSVSRVIQLDREGVFIALRDSAGRRLYTAEAVEAFAKARAAARSDRAAKDARRVPGGRSSGKRARALLARLKPFEEWLSEAPRRPEEPETAQRIIAELQAMSQGEPGAGGQ